MEQLIKENIIKNLIVIMVLLSLYLPIHQFLTDSPLAQDKPAAGDILVAVSIIAVCACFGNFAFTYEKIKITPVQKYIAHITTAILMFLLGISLMCTAELIFIIMGYSILIHILIILLYTACVGYDFWDMYKLI